MKHTVVIAFLLALLILGAMSAVALAQGPFGGGMGGGMMGRGGLRGGLGYGITPSQNISPTVPNGWGPGWMMGGFGYGVAPGQAISPTVPFGCPGAAGGGMMGGWGYGAQPGSATLTLDDAIARAQEYVKSLNNADLKLVEMEEYSWNFYGVVQEKSTGINAFQILVNKTNGAVFGEMGPNMMWNTKYSPMTRMMGGAWLLPSGQPTVTAEQARAKAAEFLKANLPNTTLEDGTDNFYGYYNFDVLQAGKTYGMLSVNAYTGAVWYHTWHGNFIAAKELE